MMQGLLPPSSASLPTSCLVHTPSKSVARPVQDAIPKVDLSDDSCAPSEDSSTATLPPPAPLVATLLDTTDMSVEEILQVIRVPTLAPHVPDAEALVEYLDQHEIGHLNHLIKCFTDAIVTVSMPDSTVGKSHILPVEFLDVYCCCVLRVYFLLFKNLDFMNLLLSDQVVLMESGVLKALLCMSFFVFKEDCKSWHIPSSISEISPVVLNATDLNQILPYNLLQQTLAINVTSTKLKFDWHMGMLCIGAFFYCPVDVQVQQSAKIDTLRDRYMEILLKYLKWKHGSYNASVMFPEILKLMDAILKHCSLVENLTLRLKDEEIHALETRLQTLNVDIDSNFEMKFNVQDCDISSGVTFAKINRRISSCVQCNLSSTLFGGEASESRHCAAVPTASMYYSNQPVESEEAKSRREVEALLIRRMLENKKQQEKIFPDKDERSNALPNVPLPPHKNLLAIQRLLQDLAQKDQIAVNPEPSSVTVSLDNDDDSAPSLPYQLLQQKLYQVTAMQQRAHLANFAKSLGYHNTIPSVDDATSDEGAEGAIDLSRPKRSITSPSSSTASKQSNSSSSKKLPALKPLPSFKNDSIVRENNLTLPRREVYSANLSKSVPGVDSSPITSQLSARHIELLLESLGKSKYTTRFNKL